VILQLVKNQKKKNMKRRLGSAHETASTFRVFSSNGQKRRSGTWRTIKDMFSQLFNDLRQQRFIPMFAG
jgi:hypothetical protein